MQSSQRLKRIIKVVTGSFIDRDERDKLLAERMKNSYATGTLGRKDKEITAFMEFALNKNLGDFKPLTETIVFDFEEVESYLLRGCHKSLWTWGTFLNVSKTIVDYLMLSKVAKLDLSPQFSNQQKRLNLTAKLTIGKANPKRAPIVTLNQFKGLEVEEQKLLLTLLNLSLRIASVKAMQPQDLISGQNAFRKNQLAFVRDKDEMTFSVRSLKSYTRFTAGGLHAVHLNCGCVSKEAKRAMGNRWPWALDEFCVIHNHLFSGPTGLPILESKIKKLEKKLAVSDNSCRRTAAHWARMQSDEEMSLVKVFHPNYKTVLSIFISKRGGRQGQAGSLPSFFLSPLPLFPS